jgi:nitrogen regulatory protein P-II 1
MKKIETIIRPEMLETIKEALNRINIRGLTIMPVMGCGNQLGWNEVVRGSDTVLTTLPKIKISTVVADENLETIIATILECAHTGEVGDGKIFVSDISDCIRIRTGERGEKAL